MLGKVGLHHPSSLVFVLQADGAFPTEDLQNLLRAAAAAGKADSIQMLLRAGADKDGADDVRTPTCRPPSARSPSFNNLIAGPSSQTHGYTALHYAAEGGHSDCVRALVAAGAATGLCDKHVRACRLLRGCNHQSIRCAVFTQPRSRTEPPAR